MHSPRLVEGFDPHGAGLRSLIADLRDVSPDFERLWQMNTARGLTQITNTIVDAKVGLIEYTSLAFDVRGVTGQQLVIVFAA